jgi:tetratricopeptide (TPR) repeat protein
MTSNVHFQRGSLLYEQGRYADAIGELRQQLVQASEDFLTHGLLSLCLAEVEKYDEATTHAQQSIALAPDRPFGYYALAQVMLHRNRYPEAEAAIREAIAVNPYDADYYAILASLHLRAGRRHEALETANQGLAIEPEHRLCTNLRAQSLINLGDRAGAAATMGEALARRPDDPYTHANQGWALLHQGKPHQALDHFREALRLDPELEFARAGIVEALKARNIVYRAMLAYFLWMSRLDGRVRIGLIVGAFVANRVVAGVAQRSPFLALLLLPVLLAYFAFVLMTWLADPLYNLLLRLDRAGRYALSADQTRGANLLAVGLLAVLACLAAAILTWQEPLFYATLLLTILLLPVSAIFVCAPGWPRRTMISISTALLAAIVLITAVELIPADRVPLAIRQLHAQLLGYVPLALFGSQVAAMYLSRAVPRK